MILLTLCWRQIETDQAVKTRSVQTFNGYGLNCFVSLFVNELIIFIPELKLDPFSSETVIFAASSGCKIGADCSPERCLVLSLSL